MRENIKVSHCFENFFIMFYYYYNYYHFVVVENFAMVLIKYQHFQFSILSLLIKMVLLYRPQTHPTCAVDLVKHTLYLLT